MGKTTRAIAVSLILLGIAVLAAAIYFTEMRLLPHMVACVIPVLLLAMLLLIDRKHIKRPAWLTFPFAFALWGGAGGLVGGGEYGAILCFAGFAAIGIGMGLPVESILKDAVPQPPGGSDEAGVSKGREQ